MKRKRLTPLIVLMIIFGSLSLPYVYAAEGGYISSWDTSGESGDPHGLCTDGTNIWIVDPTNDEVYKYTMAGVYVSSWNTSGQGTNPVGIATDGNFIWTVDMTDDEVYKYTMAGVNVSSWDTPQSGDPRGITTNGTYIWIVDFLDDEVYKYHMNGTYVDSWDTSGEGDLPFDITTDGNFIWTVDTTDKEVYKYSMTGTYNSSWDTSVESDSPRGICTDGTYIWVSDDDDDEVYKYEYRDPPTTTSASIPDMDDTDNCYAMTFYNFTVGVYDVDGATDIEKVYLRILQESTIRGEVRATDLTGAPAWAIETGATIIDLNTTACSFTEDGDNGTAVFSVAFEWDYTQEDDLELAVYVEDSVGVSAGWTTQQTNYTDVITRLVTYNFGANVSSVVINLPIELSGYVRYATTASGNLASSTSPPDGQFTAVKIQNDEEEVVGTDTVIVDGYFSASFNASSIPRTTIYYAYLDLLDDYVDALAPDGDVVYVTTITEFYLSQLIEQAFNVFGIVDYIVNATAYGTALGTYFIDSITNIVQLITQQFLFVLGIFDFFIDWYTRMMSLVTNIGSIVTGLFDGTGDIVMEVGNFWDYISFSTWIDIVPVALFIWWVESIAKRGTTQGEVTVFLGDMQTVMNVTSWFMSMFGLIINTVTDLAFRLLGVIT